MTSLRPTSREPHGAITGIYGDVVVGWAFDPQSPDTRIIVEIFVDGISAALVRADEFHPQGDGNDGFHGFVYRVQESLLDNSRVISARVANHTTWLIGTIQLPSCAPSTPSPAASQVWHSGGLLISGWAWDPLNSHRIVEVVVYEDSRVLVKGLANKKQYPVTSQMGDSHGFELDLPWHIADGNVHILDIVDEFGASLSGSPVTLCIWPQGVESIINKTFSDSQENNLALVSKIVRHQERIVPKSAGFSSYPEWFETFQKKHASCPTMDSTCGILLVSDGDKDLEALSLRSIQQQSFRQAGLEIVVSDSISPALERLIDLGCNSIIPMISGDRLAPHAIEALSSTLSEDVEWAYGDNDCDDLAGKRDSPWFKPVWDLDLFIGADLFSSGAIFGKDILLRAISLLEGSIDSAHINLEMLLAAIAVDTHKRNGRVIHLPQVIYHRHSSRQNSPCSNVRDKDREKAMNWLVQQLDKKAYVECIPAHPSLLRAQWSLPDTMPKVSIIIPTRDQYQLLKTCIDGVLHNTDYANLEIIVVDNESTDPSTLKYLAELKDSGVTILPHPFPFNYSAVNNRAAEIATGDILCLLNNDIEIKSNDWLIEMVRQLNRPEVGVVGAKLTWSNGMVQHGGVIIGINGLAAHIGNKLHTDDVGYLGLNHLTRSCSAVTGACLLIDKDLYLQNKGLDEVSYPVAFNDVDLCLRVREQGMNVVWNASSELIHAESASRGKDLANDRRARAQREQYNFIRRWFQNDYCDPYYHPSLSSDYLTGPYGGLALPPRELVYRSNR